MDIEQARLFALSLPSATEDMPFGDDWVVFRIGGKVFMHLQLDAPEPRIAIKLPPEMGMELRERYDAVRPAYHMNKRHWNDIYLEHNELIDRQIETLITISYDTVRQKLPQRVKAGLQSCQKSS